MRRVVLFVTLAALLAGVGASRARLEQRVDLAPREKPLLYLPHPKYLKVISLGHGPLLADAIYLWAIQFYSDYQREDRYRFTEHIFAEVIPELDPHYVDPYWLGALILIVEVGDLDRGLELLELGFERNPDAWMLPYLAGWEAERARRFDLAARYFAAAASTESAPPFVRRLRAGMLSRAERIDDAIRAWEEIRADPASTEGARDIAGRWVDILRTRRDVHAIEDAIEAFRARAGRNPRDLDELVDAGLLRAVPRDPGGATYGYDRTTGRVTGEAGRILRADR